MKEKQNKFLEDNNLLKTEINELKEKQEKNYEEYNLLKKDTNDLKEKNKELKAKILNNLVKIQAGEYHACFPSNTRHYMHCQSGNRTFKKHIDFDKEFESTPNVIVAIEALDTNKDTNLRLFLKKENIDNSGFDLIVGTWDNTSIFGVKISWIAFTY